MHGCGIFGHCMSPRRFYSFFTYFWFSIFHHPCTFNDLLHQRQHAGTCISTHIHTHSHLPHLYRHTHTHTHIPHTCTHTHTHKHPHLYTHTLIHTHCTHILTPPLVHTHTLMHTHAICRLEILLGTLEAMSFKVEHTILKGVDITGEVTCLQNMRVLLGG